MSIAGEVHEKCLAMQFVFTSNISDRTIEPFSKPMAEHVTDIFKNRRNYRFTAVHQGKRKVVIWPLRNNFNKVVNVYQSHSDV